LLEVKNLEAGYGSITILRNISLTVGDNEIVCVIGANGSGKTTLLKTIAGIIKRSKGQIKFNDQRIDMLGPHDIYKLGLVYVTGGMEVFPKLTVLENLLVSSSLRELKKKRLDSLKYVYHLFPILEERKKQMAGTLSGGERQMLAIARGIMAQPKLLMLDEPSAGLMPSLVTLLYEKILEIHKEKKISILLVEQDVLQALKIANRGYVLENGKIIMEDVADSLLKNKNLIKAYVGV